MAAAADDLRPARRGQRILRAIVAGERDGQVLVQYQLSCFLQTQLLLILQRAYPGNGTTVLPKCRRAHVRFRRKFVASQRVREILLESCHGPCDLLTKRFCSDQVFKHRTVAPGQQANCDFPLNQRGDLKYQFWLVEQTNEPDQCIKYQRLKFDD